MDRELRDLLAAVRDETITREQLDRLEDRLRSSDEDRKIFLGCQQLHSLLEICPPASENGESTKVVRFPTFRELSLVGAAAAIVFACVLIIQLFSRQPVTTNAVATILLAENCEWENGSTAVAEGQSLPPGQLWLKNGSAVVRFTGGAKLVLSGDTKIDLLSANRVKLAHGEVVVRAEDGEEGFTVVTPKGELIDLGTEFAVRVEDSGATELHVHEGEVAVKESIVSAGHAIRMDKDSGNDVKINAPRFAEMIKHANPRERRDLMWTYEGFHVAEGIYAPSDLATGKGWAGPWRLRNPEEYGGHGSDSSSDMQITHGRMNMAWPVKGGRLGMLELPPGRNIRLRELSRPIDFSEDGITYLSFLAAESETVESAEQAAIRRNDLRLTLRSADDYFGESLSFGWSRNRAPRVQVGNGVVHRSIREIPPDETTFCIAKISRHADSSDKIYFRFYRESDHLDYFEPAHWDIEITDANLSARLDLLLITAEGKSTRYVDEIRIGPTWRSVTPITKDS